AHRHWAELWRVRAPSQAASRPEQTEAVRASAAAEARELLVLLRPGSGRSAPRTRKKHEACRAVGSALFASRTGETRFDAPRDQQCITAMGGFGLCSAAPMSATELEMGVHVMVRELWSGDYLAFPIADDKLASFGTSEDVVQEAR